MPRSPALNLVDVFSFFRPDGGGCAAGKRHPRRAERGFLPLCPARAAGCVCNASNNDPRQLGGSWEQEMPLPKSPPHQESSRSREAVCVPPGKCGFSTPNPACPESLRVCGSCPEQDLTLALCRGAFPGTAGRFSAPVPRILWAVKVFGAVHARIVHQVFAQRREIRLPRWHVAEPHFAATEGLEITTQKSTSAVIAGTFLLVTEQ